MIPVSIHKLLLYMTIYRILQLFIKLPEITHSRHWVVDLEIIDHHGVVTWKNAITFILQRYFRIWIRYMLQIVVLCQRWIANAPLRKQTYMFGILAHNLSFDSSSCILSTKCRHLEWGYKRLTFDFVWEPSAAQQWWWRWWKLQLLLVALCEAICICPGSSDDDECCFQFRFCDVRSRIGWILLHHAVIHVRSITPLAFNLNCVQ